MWFNTILKKARKRRVSFIEPHDIPHAECRKVLFCRLIDQCEAIAKERNRIVHSTYIFLESRGRLRGIVLSKPKNTVDASGKPRVEFRQEHFHSRTFQGLMKSIAETAFELGMVHLQLIHWHGSVKPKAPATP
jgi:hypothetical protein